MDLVHFILIQ